MRQRVRDRLDLTEAVDAQPEIACGFDAEDATRLACAEADAATAIRYERILGTVNDEDGDRMGRPGTGAVKRHRSYDRRDGRWRGPHLERESMAHHGAVRHAHDVDALRIRAGGRDQILRDPRGECDVIDVGIARVVAAAVAPACAPIATFEALQGGD